MTMTQVEFKVISAELKMVGCHNYEDDEKIYQNVEYPTLKTAIRLGMFDIAERETYAHVDVSIEYSGLPFTLKIQMQSHPKALWAINTTTDSFNDWVKTVKKEAGRDASKELVDESLEAMAVEVMDFTHVKVIDTFNLLVEEHKSKLLAAGHS